MFCANCGNNLESEDNFCRKCGKAVRACQTPAKKHKSIKTDTLIFQKSLVHATPEYLATSVRPQRNKVAEAKEDKKREKYRTELKKLLEEKQGREVTDQELNESERRLYEYAELMLDLGIKEAKRQKKLEENPKGFHLEGEGYTCFICSNHVSNEETWYDKYGIKCLICQKAIDKKIIPALAAKNENSWYSKYELESRFNIDRHGLKRLLKEEVLKPRIVTDESGKPHCYLFLVKDHKDILPPKKLTEPQLIQETIEGKVWTRSEPWYKFGEPQNIFKQYKIFKHLTIIINGKEI